MKRIGIFVERQRAWGRQLCEGIASFAQERADWELTTMEREDLANLRLLAGFDGFIARVYDETVAKAFCHAQKPVADVSCERTLSSPFIRGVLQDNRAIGALAARHFIEHLFNAFAYCGFDGKRFSDDRRDAFVHCLKLNHFDCHVYKSPVRIAKELDKSIASHERLAEGADNRRLQAWLTGLPKPVAVFCANDLRAFHMLEACKSCGLKVPNDVAILGVDNDTLVCNFTSPPLSSIDPDAFSLGVSAAGCLAAALEGNDETPRKIGPTSVVTRASSEIYPLEPAWLSDALVFVRRNVNRHISAADVYAHLKLSHTAVNRAFRDKLGTTVQKEIRKAQLAEACRLLRDTALPLAEISRRTGFVTPQYFTNVFTAAFKRSPSGFRTAHAAQRRKSPRETTGFLPVDDRQQKNTCTVFPSRTTSSWRSFASQSPSFGSKTTSQPSSCPRRSM